MQTQSAEQSERPTPRGAAEWQPVVTEYLASGQSVREFCEIRGLSDTALRYWLRNFRKAEPTEPKFREYRLSGVNQVPSELEVKLGNGRSVVIRGRVDEETIRCVLALLN